MHISNWDRKNPKKQLARTLNMTARISNHETHQHVYTDVKIESRQTEH